MSHWVTNEKDWRVGSWTCAGCLPPHHEDKHVITAPFYVHDANNLRLGCFCAKCALLVHGKKHEPDNMDHDGFSPNVEKDSA